MKRRVISLILCMIIAVTGLVACGNHQYVSYDALDNPLADTDVGGSDTLVISERIIKRVI